MADQRDTNLEKRSHITLYLTEERRAFVKRVLAKYPGKSLSDAVFSALATSGAVRLPELRAFLDEAAVLIKQLPEEAGDLGYVSIPILVRIKVLSLLLDNPEEMIGRPLTDMERLALKIERTQGKEFIRAPDDSPDMLRRWADELAQERKEMEEQ